MEFVPQQDSGLLEATALEPEGPSLSLVKARNGPYTEEIAKTMAAFMVVALGRLNWPHPDCIIPSPRDLEFNLLLAHFLSDFLKVPVIEALQGPSFFYPEEGFRWKGSPCLVNQKVLLVDTQLNDLRDPFAFLDEAGIEERYLLCFC